jgi:hypothetical protein
LAKSISETKRVRYLLGLSSPAEREHIESEYFEDEEAFQEMLTAEDDLIDAYARGELASEERRRFETNFVRSLRGRERVQFARAFAENVSATRSVETKLPNTSLDILKTFQWPGLLRTTTIAAMIIFVAVLAWMASDRKILTDEIRKLRAESVELSKRTEALQRGSNTEQPHTAAPQLSDPKPRRRKRGTITTQRARYLPEIKNNREKIASSKPKQAEKFINTQDASLGNSLTPQNRSSSGSTTVRGTAKDPNGNAVSGAIVTLTNSTRNFTRTQSTNKDGAYLFKAIPPGSYSIKVEARGFKTALTSGLVALVDTPTVHDLQLEVGYVSETVTSPSEAAINTNDATLGNSFEPKLITELPPDVKNVVGLLTLQPSVSSTGAVNGERADQSNVTLEGVDVNGPVYSVDVSVRLDSADAIIHIPSALRWIRFQIALETAAIHEHYRVTIKTADGRPVTSDDWSEPLTPEQTIIDTPAILTSDLPSGDYVLLLMGKESDNSFVKVAEYSFKVIKY